jgi:hypothetical protein
MITMDLEISELDLRYETLRVRCPEKDRRLLASLSEAGQLVPIVVVAADDGAERRVVVDGYRRIRALLRLRRDVVDALEWQTSELVDELRRRFGLTLEELARHFDRSPSWVSRRLALVRELPASIQDLIRQGRIVPHAAAKHLVPLARANPDQCERLAMNIAAHRLSTREVGEIHAAWRDGSASARQHIVEDPDLFLRTRRALLEESSDGLGPRTGLLEDVAALAAISRRASHRVREGAVAAISPAERDEVRHGLEAIQARLARLAREVKEAIGGEHARPADKSRGPGSAPKGGLDSEDCSCVVDLPGGGAGRPPFGNGRGSKVGARGEGRAVP